MSTELRRRTFRADDEKHLSARNYVSDRYKPPKPLVAGVSAFLDWSRPLVDNGGFSTASDGEQFALLAYPSEDG
jgi:hypothetical protein